MSWFLAFAGFAVLIILHEAGHFAAAKATGMRVEKFMLFFGKPLFGFRRGETFYGVGPIPLGGFVKITGMNPTEEVPPEVAHRTYWRQPVWKRLVVIGAGPAVNLVLAFLILFVLFATTTQIRSSDRIYDLEQGKPAAAQLQKGDRVVAVDGEGGKLADFSQRIASHRCAGAQKEGCPAAQPVEITVVRDGERRTFALRPLYDAEAGRMRLGFGYGEPYDLGIGGAAKRSVNVMWDVTSATVGTIGRLFYDAQARKEVSGVVGSYEATRQSFEFDTKQAILILGLISLSLAVVNLFPFLPLDGGHIFWALAEKVRGRAIPFRVMERASVIGFMLVGVLFFIGLQNDVKRIGNGEISRSVR